MTRKSLFALLPCLVLGVVLLASCANPLSGLFPDNEGTGSLLVSINELAPKILVPDLDMNIASYTISGSGPNGGSFLENTTVSPLAISSLKSGAWEVSAEALNADGIAIGEGQAQVAVLAGQTASASINLKPKSGYGTLSLAVLWTAAELQGPAITARLLPNSGSAITLSFSVTPGRATYSGAIPTGYFTLSLQLQEGAAPVMGAIEIVRIVKDQTTAGQFQFYDLNLPGGGLEVVITPAMDDPLPVSLSGQVDVLEPGRSMTVSAVVPAGTGEVVCTWYLNGVSKAVGASYAVGSGLAAGVYRLDVSVYTADGARAGSATHSLRISEAPAAQATLMWDANAEPDLAGYKLYYGAASGSYDTVVDVGNLTTYTLTGLEPGRTYYVVAKAYNASGLESDPSNEISVGL